VAEMIILKWMLKKLEVCGVDTTGSEQGPVVGSCEHGSGPSGSS